MDRGAPLGLLAVAALWASCATHREEVAEVEPPIHERIDLPSIAACGGCHQQVWEEWSRSLHAKAWTNANVLSATDNFRKQSCRPCHSPQSVLVTGLDRAPDYRDFNQEDGVHCLSCHGLPDGVAAARTLPEAPCRPRAEPRMRDTYHCYPCHQPTHQAFDEYEESRAFAEGTRCIDCHMPLREDGSGRSHGPHGGMNAEFVRTAIDWEVREEPGELVVVLTNLTGHKFPGEIPSRSFLLRIESEVGTETVLLRKPHKGEARVDNRLLPDETRELRFPRPQGEVAVRLLFQPLPLLGPDQCFELGRWTAAK